MLVYLFLGTLSSSLLSLVGKNIPSGKLCFKYTCTNITNGNSKRLKEERFFMFYSKKKSSSQVITHYTVYNFFTITPMGKQVLVNQGFEAFNSLSNHTW